MDYKDSYKYPKLNENTDSGNKTASMNFDHPAWKHLEEASMAEIVQKPDYLEAITGLEFANVYKVYVKKTGDQYKKVKIFKCKESSGFCTRNCLPPECRPFKMKIKYEVDEKESKNFDDHCATLVRDFKCTCLCFNRPTLDVFWNEPRETHLGKIISPFSICGIDMQVYGTEGELKYVISGSCCQCGLLCPKTCCGTCSDVMIPIFKAGDSSRNINDKVGMIRKFMKNFVAEVITDADNFEITFPNDATVVDKFNLISAVLMIDYQYFEENEKVDDKKNYQK